MEDWRVVRIMRPSSKSESVSDVICSLESLFRERAVEPQRYVLLIQSGPTSLARRRRLLNSLSQIGVTVSGWTTEGDCWISNLRSEWLDRDDRETSDTWTNVEDSARLLEAITSLCGDGSRPPVLDEVHVVFECPVLFGERTIRLADGDNYIRHYRGPGVAVCWHRAEPSSRRLQVSAFFRPRERTEDTVLKHLSMLGVAGVGDIVYSRNRKEEEAFDAIWDRIRQLNSKVENQIADEVARGLLPLPFPVISQSLDFSAPIPLEALDPPVAPARDVRRLLREQLSSLGYEFDRQASATSYYEFSKKLCSQRRAVVMIDVGKPSQQAGIMLQLHTPITQYVAAKIPFVRRGESDRVSTKEQWTRLAENLGVVLPEVEKRVIEEWLSLVEPLERRLFDSLQSRDCPPLKP